MVALELGNPNKIKGFGLGHPSYSLPSSGKGAVLLGISAMAGDWIKIEVVTPDKPEVDNMAEYLEVTPEHVLGCLIRLWIWADQQSINGHGLRVTRKTINRVSNLDRFANALEKVGWLCGNEGEFDLPNFERHNGDTAKSRGLAQKRQARHRTNKRHASVTFIPSPEYISSLLSSSLSKYKEIDTPEFKTKLQEWLQYRDDHPKRLTPYTEQGIKSVLTRLSKMDPGSGTYRFAFSCRYFSLSISNLSIFEKWYVRIT